MPPAPPSEEEVFARMSLEELNDARPLEDVYFDLDRAELSDAARASLQKNSTWMRRWTSTRILIEGHADARGTSEYNLALGERRAASVRDYLASLGIDASRISVVSKGEEDPVCMEDGEACWSRNRRGHFTVTAK
ncbi:MAG TPA: peptidoglycan-associated lipoprotein Pal [Vicinamibacterales bacterium]|nr:peptidoglycan-associated lipoprotein Pal [Vicinamibacterales bacterium]